MSDTNRMQGRECYAKSDAERRAWFEYQWKIWPIRAHDARTTNLSYHHGGVQAYREIHGSDPAMSDSLAENIAFLDKE